MASDNRTGQYSAVATFLTAYIPGWLPLDEGLRVASYKFYDDLYWNDVGNFQLTIRGDEDYPVYVPSARRVINTFARYTARGVKYSITATASSEQEIAELAFSTLFRRERFWTKFHTEKKRGATRGDWVIMIIGDAGAPEGRRLSIKTVDPSKYFVLFNPEDKAEKWGCAIIELVPIGDKSYVKVQRWLKPTHPDHLEYNPDPEAVVADMVPISYESVIYEQENWNDPLKRKTFRILSPLALLPGITALPLYHFRTNVDEDAPYGVSDLRGIERIFLAINQTATDQDVSLAMAGLGMYVSDSSPVDAAGQSTDWVLGPKRVVEVPKDGKFDRVSGTGSVQPSLDHIEFLQGQAESLQGINDIALGDVEVSVAESGIALSLRMGPILDASADRDLEIGDILTQFFFDLKQWFLIYERINLPTTEILPIFPDKLPVDIDKRLEQIQTLWTNGLVSKEWVWDELIKLGLDIDPATMMSQLEAGGGFSEDPEGDRLAQEAEPDDTAVTADDGGPE